MHFLKPKHLFNYSSSMRLLRAIYFKKSNFKLIICKSQHEKNPEKFKIPIKYQFSSHHIFLNFFFNQFAFMKKKHLKNDCDVQSNMKIMIMLDTCATLLQFSSLYVVTCMLFGTKCSVIKIIVSPLFFLQGKSDGIRRCDEKYSRCVVFDQRRVERKEIFFMKMAYTQKNA